MYLKMEDSFHYTHHLFKEIGIILLEWERKLERVKKRQRLTVRKKQPVKRNSNSRRHFLNKVFVNKALSNFDLEEWIDKLRIKNECTEISSKGWPQSKNKPTFIFTL